MLLLEDVFLIALDIEVTLKEAGLDVVAFHSCRPAEAWLVNHRPDAAVIDIELADGPCTSIAAVLVESGIPFVVHSAVSRAAAPYHHVFDSGHWLPKPTPTVEIAQAILDLLATTAVSEAN